MKVIKGCVRNKNKPKGCIAKENVVEEIIKLLSEYRKSIHTVGIPQDKHNTIDNDRATLSAAYSSKVCTKLFNKSHFIVLQNTPEVYLYIE